MKAIEIFQLTGPRTALRISDFAAPDSDAGRPVRDPDRGREPVRSRVDSVETVVGAYPATIQHPRRSGAKRNRGRAAVDHDPGADCAGRRIEAKHDPLLVRHHHATPPLVPAAGADEPYRAVASRHRFRRMCHPHSPAPRARPRVDLAERVGVEAWDPHRPDSCRQGVRRLPEAAPHADAASRNVDRQEGVRL